MADRRADALMTGSSPGTLVQWQRRLSEALALAASQSILQLQPLPEGIRYRTATAEPA